MYPDPAEMRAREDAARGVCPCLRDEEAGPDDQHLIGPLEFCPEHGHLARKS